LALLGAGLLFVAAVGTPASADTNHFDAGYCTWDTAEQAHRAWSIWVPWFGDAGDWIEGARASGWRVSPQPEVASIAVMPPYVQGSGPYGHVAWVLAVDADGATVTVRSMNWSGPGVITVHELLVDGVVQFVTPAD
jgi:surface antigen